MKTDMRPSIAELEERIAALPPDARAAAERIFSVSTTASHLVPPPEMHEWIKKQFGSVEAVTTQQIVRVTNRVLLEGALFNDLRARRPSEVKGADEVRETIERSRNDPFCHPETGTPADTFGRIKGEHGITASNIAKYDAYHGVLVFDEHDPLAPMDASIIRDRLLVARRWAEAANEEDPSAKYYFMIWNCLWRAGGSIVHGHMQMTVTRGMHYPRVESPQAFAVLRRAAGTDSSTICGSSTALGLALLRGARVFPSLRPVKERRHHAWPTGEDETRRGRIAHVSPNTASKASSHTLGLLLSAPVGTVTTASIPSHALLVDRGDPANRRSHRCEELYAASVVPPTLSGWLSCYALVRYRPTALCRSVVP